jgi:hypothetical protein
MNLSMSMKLHTAHLTPLSTQTSEQDLVAMSLAMHSSPMANSSLLEVSPNGTAPQLEELFASTQTELLTPPSQPMLELALPKIFLGSICKQLGK